MLKIGTGRLRWTEAATLASTPSTIALAWEGYCEELEALERIAYGAQGIQLPERKPAGRPSVKEVADRWRLFKAGHNAQIAAKSLPRDRPPGN